MNIGIEENLGLIYEGSGSYGHALWPSPVITPAKFVFASDEIINAEKSGIYATSCQFREDYFDSIARVRRGRFYFSGGVQPVEWHVQPHPAFPLEGANLEKRGLTKRLETFYSKPIWYEFIEGRHELPLVLLGIDDRFTSWTIVSIEAIWTGEDLVTLKARSSLGILPLIQHGKIPGPFRARVIESLNAFADEVHRSAPISVIDRARDSATECILAHFELAGNDARDLGVLAKRLETKKRIIAASAAKIIARLHARAKPAERAKRDLRPIKEQDAELATKCMGAILCELGWADWA